MRACSAWLETGQLCVKIENYSGAIGSADPTNSLSTNAYITDESGTIVSDKIYKPSEMVKLAKESVEDDFEPFDLVDMLI